MSKSNLNGTIPPQFFLNNVQLVTFHIYDNIKLSGSLPYLPSNSSLRCLDIRGTSISGGLSSSYLKIVNARLMLPDLGFNISEINNDIKKYDSVLAKCDIRHDNYGSSYIECRSYIDSDAENHCPDIIPKNKCC